MDWTTVIINKQAAKVGTKTRACNQNCAVLFENSTSVFNYSKYCVCVYVFYYEELYLSRYYTAIFFNLLSALAYLLRCK